MRAGAAVGVAGAGQSLYNVWEEDGLLTTTQIPALGESVALRTARDIETSGLVIEVRGGLVHVRCTCEADPGEELDVAWFADDRVVRGCALLVEHSAGGVWADLRDVLPVSGRWLRRSVPAGTVWADLRLTSTTGDARVVAGGRLQDIGLGGAGILVSEPIVAGEEGDAVFLAADGRAIAGARVRVLHVAGHAAGLVVGCRFPSLTEGGAVVAAVEAEPAP